MQTVMRHHIVEIATSLVKNGGEHFEIPRGLLGNARSLDPLSPNFVAISERFDDIRTLALLHEEHENEILLNH